MRIKRWNDDDAEKVIQRIKTENNSLQESSIPWLISTKPTKSPSFLKIKTTSFINVQRITYFYPPTSNTPPLLSVQNKYNNSVRILLQKPPHHRLKCPPLSTSEPLPQNSHDNNLLSCPLPRVLNTRMGNGQRQTDRMRIDWEVVRKSRFRGSLESFESEMGQRESRCRAKCEYDCIAISSIQTGC